jgi:hypothetical protein
VKLGCPTVKDLISRFRWQLKFRDVELSLYTQAFYFSILLDAFHRNVYASLIFGITISTLFQMEPTVVKTYQFEIRIQQYIYM